MSASDGVDPSYVAALVDSWSQTHKKGALVMLVLVSLESGPAWSGDLHEAIASLTGGHLQVDDQSLHRALRRLEAHNVITHSAQPVPGTGAKRKVFELTRTGDAALREFLATTMTYATHPTFTALMASVQHQ